MRNGIQLLVKKLHTIISSPWRRKRFPVTVVPESKIIMLQFRNISLFLLSWPDILITLIYSNNDMYTVMHVHSPKWLSFMYVLRTHLVQYLLHTHGYLPKIFCLSSNMFWYTFKHWNELLLNITQVQARSFIYVLIMQVSWITELGIDWVSDAGIHLLLKANSVVYSFTLT